ncbi:MAG: cation:proton antiporter [Rickettsiales bacterium]|nr:cation:proton antiporter [Rickettsiales bacterium]
MQILDFIHQSPFYEFASLLTLSALIGYIGLLFRQPMIVSFIIVGVISGPSVLNIMQSYDNIELLAEIGIAILLFLVGLKLDVNLVNSLGKVAIATGVGQVFFTALISFSLGYLIGLDNFTNFYISFAITFSSTIIIVKLLSDKKEVDSLHGRIAIGFLIVQDIIVVVAMMILSTLTFDEISTTQESKIASIQKILQVFGGGAGFLVFIFLFVKFFANKLINKIAHSTELLVIFAITWAVLLATIGSLIGFSKELGGLLAGISLASTPIREAIIARLSSLRDFLLLFFFITLGSKLDINLISEKIIIASIYSVFVLLLKPLIMLIIMALMGYRKRTSFLVGTSIAQISEFSLIFMAMGVSLGHIDKESLALLTLIGLITISLSVYFINYSHNLYGIFEPYLGIFEKDIKNKNENELHKIKDSYDVILFGAGRFGSAIAEKLKKKCKLLIIDFNPSEVKKWRRKGFQALYGDASDQEFISHLPLDETKWVICSIPKIDLGIANEDCRFILLDALKRNKFKGKIAISTQYIEEKPILKFKGADEVFLPFQDASALAVEKICKNI